MTDYAFCQNSPMMMPEEAV